MTRRWPTVPELLVLGLCACSGPQGASVDERSQPGQGNLLRFAECSDPRCVATPSPPTTP